MSGWLAILLLTAAVNPPRRRRELPIDAAVVAAGAGLTLAVLLGVGAVGDRLLDTLDISAPTFRVAVGMVLLVRGVIDMVSRPPGPGAEWSGMKGAIVPGFFPVLFRPEIALTAMSVAVDGGVGIMSVGAAVALFLVVASVLWLHRFDRALSIVLSATLIVLAVDRLVDGVFAL